MLAEWLIFRHARNVSGLPLLGFPPTMGAPQPPMVIIRVAWHLLSVFGAGFAVILVHFSAHGVLTGDDRFVVVIIAWILSAGFAGVFLGTRGKHIGWIGFAVAAGCCWAALLG